MYKYVVVFRIVLDLHVILPASAFAVISAYSDLQCSSVPEAHYLYFTGYMWDTPNQRSAVEKAAAQGRERGGAVAFDLADPFAVERYRDAFAAWVPDNVDVLFGNAQELRL